MKSFSGLLFHEESCGGALEQQDVYLLSGV